MSQGHYVLEENAYKVDQEVLDRYVGTTSEVARLALVFLGVAAFLLQPGTNGFCLVKHSMLLQALLAAASAFSALSVGAALGHRYVATDAFAEHIHLLRRRAQEPANGSGLEASRNRKLRVSGPLIATSAGLLTLAVLCGVMFAAVMLQTDGSMCVVAAK